jgi:hypothetical protein
VFIWSVSKLRGLQEKLGLLKGHYYLHVAVLAGLPVSLISDLASELDRSRSGLLRPPAVP